MSVDFKKRFITILSIVTVTILAGCASIPKESVDLSAGIGIGITESRRSHINLLNVYFTAKRTDLDHWIENEYLPKYLANIQAGLKKANLPEALTASQQIDVIKTILAERDQRQADLEKSRLFIYEYLDNHYATLIQANAGVTAVLRSAVNVKDSTSQISGTLSKATSGKIDLGQIEEKFNEYLIQAGSDAGKATSLYEQIKNIINTKGDK